MVDSSLVGFLGHGLPSLFAFSSSWHPLCNISTAIVSDQITFYNVSSSSGSHSGKKSISRSISHASYLNSRGLWSNVLKGNNLLKGNVVRAAASEHSSSMSDPLEAHATNKPSYHPFEEIDKPLLKSDSDKDARLTDAEITRTMIEVNNKAAIAFSGMIDDEVHENVVWPELPYVTDEHGDIYFKVDQDEGIVQYLASENNLVTVIIGLDNMEIVSDMGLPGQSDVTFGLEEITDEDTDTEENYESDDNDEDDEDWVAILDDEDDDKFDSSDTLGDWANLETMDSCHPLHFARRIADVASNPHSGCIDLPCTGISIQGMLRPAFFEEHSTIQKNSAGELLKDENLQLGVVFYKMEIITIHLASANGNQSVVNVDDFHRAKPDVIAHSAAKIISRLDAGGEKMVQALKSICWRCKGILVEEATLIGVDSLGFDLRVCSGTQVQNLRFAFNSRATSEYSAERQLHDLLFPRIHPKLRNCRENHKND